MVTCVILLLVLTASAVMQALLPGFLVLGQAKFPFLLAVVLYHALNRGAPVMLAVAVLAGFLQDSLSPVPLGYSPFCFCVIGALTARFRDTVLTEAFVTQAFFGALTGCCATVMLYVLLVREGLVHVPFRIVVLKMFGSAVLGSVSVPFVFLVMGRLDRLVGNVKEAEVEVSIDEFGGPTQQ
jgi:rod shape-determining protein MreD